MQERRRKEDLLRRIDELQRELLEFDERTNYPEPRAKTTVLLDKPSVIVRARQLYIWHTVFEDDRVKKGWKMKDAYRKWNEYIDDASEEEVSTLSYPWVVTSLQVAKGPQRHSFAQRPTSNCLPCRKMM